MPKTYGRQPPLRRSQFINRKHAQSIFRAFDFASALGLPFTVYVVLNIRETASLSATTAFTHIRHKYRDWLAYARRAADGHLCQPTYAYTLENKAGLIHVNWAVHVPPAWMAEFLEKLPRWSEKVHGKVELFDIDVQSIKLGTEKRLAKYFLKGTDPAFVDHFYLREVHAPQGEIWGKRAGMSMNVGATARRNAGFKKPRRFGIFSPIQPMSR